MPLKANLTIFPSIDFAISLNSSPGISEMKFKELGMQIAAGVPLMCDEPKSFQTFRIGLFGLDKLYNVDRTIDKLEKAFDSVL